jgi:hypothetical protein
VATVGDAKITVDQVRNAYSNEVQRLGRQFRTVISPSRPGPPASTSGSSPTSSPRR